MNQREKTWSLAQPLSTAVHTQGWTCASCSPWGWKSRSQSADTLGLASKDCNAPATVFLGPSRTWGGLRGGEKVKSAERETPLRIAAREETEDAEESMLKLHLPSSPTHSTPQPQELWLPFLFLLILKINLWGRQTCGCLRAVCRSWFSLHCVYSEFQAQTPKTRGNAFPRWAIYLTAATCDFLLP